MTVSSRSGAGVDGIGGVAAVAVVTNGALGAWVGGVGVDLAVPSAFTSA